MVMPNHMHGIIFIVPKEKTISVGAPLAGAQTHEDRGTARVAPTLGLIIGAYKFLCVNEWLKYLKENKLNYEAKFWQRNFYEHVIRDEGDLNRIREYIQNNPATWDTDENNLKHIK